jgi:hypothetical protein
MYSQLCTLYTVTSRCTHSKLLSSKMTHRKLKKEEILTDVLSAALLCAVANVKYGKLQQYTGRYCTCTVILLYTEYYKIEMPYNVSKTAHKRSYAGSAGFLHQKLRPKFLVRKPRTLSIIV